MPFPDPPRHRPSLTTALDAVRRELSQQDAAFAEAVAERDIDLEEVAVFEAAAQEALDARKVGAAASSVDSDARPALAPVSLRGFVVRA